MNDDAYTDPQKQFQLSEIIGNSPGMVRLRAHVDRLLSRQIAGGRLPPILLEGETGTGKGLMARALHRCSVRSAEPFIDVDCVAIPETLLEAELFGYERGAFTDARQTKPGLFQLADRGTIFLDEIGLLPRSLQAKLLKVVEDRHVRRLGGTRSQIVDAWIITATNEDLAVATRARLFREDLYHRLAAVTLRMPPLRERGADILLLAERFLARVSTEYGLPTRMLSRRREGGDPVASVAGKRPGADQRDRACGLAVGRADRHRGSTRAVALPPTERTPPRWRPRRYPPGSGASGGSSTGGDSWRCSGKQTGICRWPRRGWPCLGTRSGTGW